MGLRHLLLEQVDQDVIIDVNQRHWIVPDTLERFAEIDIILETGRRRFFPEALNPVGQRGLAPGSNDPAADMRHANFIRRARSLDPIVIDALDVAGAGLALLDDVRVGRLQLVEKRAEIAQAGLRFHRGDKADLFRVIRIEMGHGDERLAAQVGQERMEQIDILLAEQSGNCVVQRFRIGIFPHRFELRRLVAGHEIGRVRNRSEGDGVGRHQFLGRDFVRAVKIPPGASRGCTEYNDDDTNQTQHPLTSHRANLGRLNCFWQTPLKQMIDPDIVRSRARAIKPHPGPAPRPVFSPRPDIAP